MEARITALGTYVPEKIVTNFDFEKIVETSDEWIVKRTGIRERRFAAEGEFTTDLCYQAAQNLQDEYGKSIKDVDFIIVGTASPDQGFPSVASQLQHRLGIPAAGAIDITAACAGFAYGIILARGLIASGTYRKVLVFGAETLSKILDFTDRASCILFGDGAGVVLVEAAEKGNILGTITGTEGEGGSSLYLTNLSTRLNGTELIADRNIHQDGRKVFKWAITTISKESTRLAENSGLDMKDIDWYIPHSANMRIIEALCNNTGLPMEKALESITDYGNTSSASIPLALGLGIKAGKVKKGDTIMMIGFGGGLVYAGIVVKWGV